MAVNLRGAFFMSQAAARAMADSGRGGRIVNISSQGGLVGLLMRPCIAPARVAPIDSMMTKTLALEWAKDAITVDAVAPTSSIRRGQGADTGISPRCPRGKKSGTVSSKIPLPVNSR